eukprot:NODE_332_length_10744_cov_0.374072.p4 type:complete len:379 gc:universal NODE_332_length_10744_cov_0.374072:9383-10519(+)
MPFVVTIGATDISFTKPTYSENCAAQLGVTLSSGQGKSIVTTNWIKNSKDTVCTDKHGGTSAAAPLAAGMIALFLSVRPDLMWRDVQHIVLKSARPFVSEGEDWQTVAHGRKFSHVFGYGLLDAHAMVNLAKNWTLVNKEVKITSPVISVNRDIRDGETVESKYIVDPSSLASSYFGDLEHVTVKLSINHSHRGDLEITLVSPNNYISYLAKARKSDYHSQPLVDWTMSSVVHFGENPVGTWKIMVKDANVNSKSGTFVRWQLTLMGSSNITNPPNVTDSVPSKAGNNSTIIPDKPKGVPYDGGSNGTIVAVFLIFGFVGFAFYYFKQNSTSHHRIKVDDDVEERQVLHDANEFFEDDFELDSLHHSSPRKHAERDQN